MVNLSCSGAAIRFDEIQAEAKKKSVELLGTADAQGNRRTYRVEVARPLLEDLIAERLTDAELLRLRPTMNIAESDVEQTFLNTAKANNLDADQLEKVLKARGSSSTDLQVTSPQKAGDDAVYEWSRR